MKQKEGGVELLLVKAASLMVAGGGETEGSDTTPSIWVGLALRRKLSSRVTVEQRNMSSRVTVEHVQ